MKYNNIYEQDSDPKHKLQWGKTIVFGILSIIMLTCLLVGCVSNDEDTVPVSDVLLVYLGGDNNLSGESYDKLQAITAGYRGAPYRRILVYRDSQNEPPYLQEITDANDIRTLETYGQENSASEKVFRRVILKTKSLYPEAKLNLLVFSHASGWLPSGSLNNPKTGILKSILMDGDDEMELNDFISAIPDNTFETIILETCFSAGIEVAYSLRNKTQYILASSAEIVSPGFTNIYPEAINHLLGADGLKKFAQTAFDYFDSRPGEYRSVTLSVIKTAYLEELGRFVQENCDSNKEVEVNDIQHFDRYAYSLFFDFGDYYSRLLETEEQQRQLEYLIAQCVPWKASTDSFLPGYNGFQIKKHSGLTTYILQESFPQLNEKYQQQEWYKVQNGYQQLTTD